MANILIIEDRPDLAGILKKEMEGGGHRVTITTRFGEQQGRLKKPTADLVIVNYGFMNNSGWKIFNRIKENDDSKPVLLYALDQWRPTRIGSICSAVDEALNCVAKRYIKAREKQKSMCF